MRPEELREFRRPGGFRPFRITMKSGRTYDVGHPDNLRVMRTEAMIFFVGADGIPDTFEMISLLLIGRVFRLDMPATPKGNGQVPS